jgi:hypothetical protein
LQRPSEKGDPGLLSSAFTTFKGADNIEAKPFSVVFINSGNRPATLLSVSVALWESPTKPVKEQVENRNCIGVHDDDKDANYEADNPFLIRLFYQRKLETTFDPLIVKEKEIERRIFNFRGSSSWRMKAVEYQDGISFPYPAWVKKEKEYWVLPCLSFQFATPSVALASATVVFFGYDEKAEITAIRSFDETPKPKLIWRKRGTVFD